MLRLAARGRGGVRPPPSAAALSSQPPTLPEHARVAVVGGGIIGTSVCYHLAKAGWSNGEVLLLERDQLTSGTTWHAAGLMVTFGSLSETSTEFRKYSKKLYSDVLEAETGQATGFKPCGFVELATDRDYLEEYRRTAAFNRMHGVDVHEISPQEVQRMFPLCRTDDVLAGFYVEDDGRVNPVDATAALAAGARMHGAQLVEHMPVAEVTTTPDGKRVTGVRTADGQTVRADYVVNCCGMWARQFAERSGVAVPNQAAEHYYLLTDAMPEVDPDWPVVEDPSSHTYIRPEGGGLLVGLFEPDAAAWMAEAVPNHFSFGEIAPDWDRLAPFLEKAMNRVPATLGVGMKKLFCGPESFTPDLSPVLGEAPELNNYFVAAGLNSIGILTGPGVGRMMAHWIMHGQPDMDVTGVNIDRFHGYQTNIAYRTARSEESLGRVYSCHFPYFDSQSCRGIKRSPLHARLEERGAYFRDVSGWEGADWFNRDLAASGVGKLGWSRPPWFDSWRREHHACRTGAALVDMSFMSKFKVQGRDAGKLLNWLATANVDGESGTITYCQFLNEHGTLEADLTVTKVSSDDFMVVATDTMQRHVEGWLKRHITDQHHVVVTDVTGALAQINIQGPDSRAALAAVTSADVSGDAFPFRTAREIDIGMARALCTRITYVGELGYELFVPTEMAVHVFDELISCSIPVTPVGLKALGSLRMEKGYRDYGHDLDNTDSLLEAGLGFTCDFDKPGGFVGREHVLAQRQAGPLGKRLASVVLQDPEPLMFHGEIVYRNGEIVGDVRAASYGHTLGGAVGLTMVQSTNQEPINKAYLDSGEWEVDVAGVRYPAKVSLRPPYDPTNKRIKA